MFDFGSNTYIMSAAAAAATNEQPLFYLYGGLTGRCWRAPTRDKLNTFFNKLEDSIPKGLFFISSFTR